MTGGGVAVHVGLGEIGSFRARSAQPSWLCPHIDPLPSSKGSVASQDWVQVQTTTPPPLVVWSPANELISLSLSFFLCKIGVIIVSIHRLWLGATIKGITHA